MNIFQFMSDSPILTFCICLIIGDCISNCVNYVCEYRIAKMRGDDK